MAIRTRVPARSRRRARVRRRPMRPHCCSAITPTCKKLFKQYEKLADAEADGEERQALAEQICTMLTVHATIEEEIFYPAAREAEVEDDLLDEAEVEHASAKDLIAQIQSMSPDDELYDAKVTVLGEYIDHHVQEEEGEMFPKCRRAKMDLAGLAEALAERKAELMARSHRPSDLRRRPARRRRRQSVTLFAPGAAISHSPHRQGCGKLAAAPKSMNAHGPANLQSSLVEGPPRAGRRRPDPGQRGDDAGLRAARGRAQQRADRARLAGGRRAPAGGDGLARLVALQRALAQRRAAAAGGDACRRAEGH